MDEADSQRGKNNDNVRRKKRRRAPAPDHVVDNIKYLQHRVDGSASSYCFSCIKLANSDNIPKIQRCAYYLGALTNFFPSLFETAKEALHKMGYGVIEIHDGNQGFSEVPILGPIGVSRLAAMIGQLILILYKNMNEQSYERYMKSRSAALRKEAGVCGPLVEGDDSDILLSFANAEIISNTLRTSHILRSQVMQAVIWNASNNFVRFGQVSGYIMRILEWAEMSSVKFICDNLVKYESPVMNDARLASEVANLNKALDEINKTPCPVYYPTIHPDSASRILHKSRFPNLVVIATRIKMFHHQPIGNYVEPANYDAGLVEEMVKEHLDYLEEKMPRAELVDRLHHYADLVFNRPFYF